MQERIKVFEGFSTRTFVLGENKLVVDIEGDQLFFNGSRLKTTKLEYRHNKSAMFEKNKGKEKKPILTCLCHGTVLSVHVGWDGRIFIKEFTREDFYTFRKPPLRVWSYWHDRKAKEKKWFDGDLHEPKNVWGQEYLKEVNIQLVK